MLYASLLCEERRYSALALPMSFQLGRPEYRIKYFEPFAARALLVTECTVEDMPTCGIRLRLLSACRRSQKSSALVLLYLRLAAKRRNRATWHAEI
jgi:hypothetical protein